MTYRQLPGPNSAQTALGALAEGVVVQRASGEIVSCNPAAERILGLTREQLSGRTSTDPCWRAIHEDGSPFPGETHPAMATLATGRAMRGVVMGIHRPDGSLRWISVNAEPIGPPDAPVSGVLTTFVDITGWKQAQRQLVENEQRFRQVFENSGEAIFLTDPADPGTTLAVNPAACRMLGWSEEELLRMGRAAGVDVTDPRLPAALAERERAGVFRGELRSVRSDGTVFPVEVVSTLYTEPSGARRSSTLIRDLSAIKEVEERVRRLNAELEGKVEERTTRLRREVAARERGEARLRQLSARLMQAQDAEQRRIARELHDVTGQDLAALGILLGRLARLDETGSGLARELLAESRLLARKCDEEVRTLSYRLRPPLLEEMGLEPALRQYAGELERVHGVPVSIEASGLPELDPARALPLFMVAREALLNAARHSGSPSVTVRLTHDGRRVRLEVADRGRGIQAPRQRGDLLGGLGILGMQERMTAAGGKLRIVTGPSGTTVVATVPG